MVDEINTDWQMVQDKLADMAGARARMQQDEADYFLTPYKMKQLPPYDTQDMPDVVNVTLNDPLVYGNKSKAVMNGAQMQTIVEGRDMKDKETTKVEEFLEDFLYILDERLVKQDVFGLDQYVNEQLLFRGRSAARVSVRIEGKDNLIPDVLPIDALNFPYDTDGEKMTWGAPIFRVSRTWIKEQYGHDITSSFGEVVDLWKNDVEKVFIEGKLVEEKPNTYGYPPFVVSICPTGSSFNTVGAAEHRGESIFWSNRALWAEKNRTATILQTLNLTALFNTMQYESSQGEGAKKPSDSPFGMRKVVPVEKGAGYKPMPIADIKNATRLFYAVLDAAMQKGSLAVIDYGTLAFPLSAIAITRLTGAREDIFLPIVQAKATFYQALSRMVIKQLLAIGKSFSIGEPGSTNEYTPADLDGDYTIRYRFFTPSKEQDIADLSIVNAAKGTLSGDTLRRDYLRLKDPDGEESKLLSEQSEQADEVLFLYRRASKLIEQERNLEAYILAKRIVTILKQRRLANKMLEAQEKPQETQAGGENLLPLFGSQRGGGGGSPITPKEPTEAMEVGREQEVQV